MRPGSRPSRRAIWHCTTATSHNRAGRNTRIARVFPNRDRQIVAWARCTKTYAAGWQRLSRRPDDPYLHHKSHEQDHSGFEELTAWTCRRAATQQQISWSRFPLRSEWSDTATPPSMRNVSWRHPFEISSSGYTFATNTHRSRSSPVSPEGLTRSQRTWPSKRSGPCGCRSLSRPTFTRQAIPPIPAWPKTDLPIC